MTWKVNYSASCCCLTYVCASLSKSYEQYFYWPLVISGSKPQISSHLIPSFRRPALVVTHFHLNLPDPQPRQGSF